MIRKQKEIFQPEEDSINITPLLDMIFILIFFFLVATTLKKEVSFVNVSLPKADYVDEKEFSGDILVVDIDKGNKIYLNNEQVTTEELSNKLKGLNDSGIKSIIIRGDSDSSLQTSVSILDKCLENKFYNVFIEVKGGQKDRL